MRWIALEETSQCASLTTFVKERNGVLSLSIIQNRLFNWWREIVADVKNQRSFLSEAVGKLGR